MTGEQIWSSFYMGVPVYRSGHKQRSWECEMHFRYSKRQWNVRLDTIEGQRDPDLNVVSTVY